MIESMGVDGLFSNDVNAAFIVEKLLPELQHRRNSCQAGKSSSAIATGVLAAAVALLSIAVLVLVVRLCCPAAACVSAQPQGHTKLNDEDSGHGRSSDHIHVELTTTTPPDRD